MVDQVKVFFEKSSGDTPIGVSNPLPVSISTFSSTSSKVDKSGSIASGGVSQLLIAANSTRKGWQLQNNSTQDLWFNELGGSATIAQPSFKLSPGGAYESPVGASSTAAISIIGPTTGQSFTAREW